MQPTRQYSLFEHIVSLSIAIAISMPLFNYSMGSAVTYLFYLFAIISSIMLNRSQISFSYLDFPIIIFFTIYLFSTFYAVNPNYHTELLFIPTLFFLYYGGRGIEKRNLMDLLLNYTSLIFILFSFYLLYWLSKVNFSYGNYFFYSAAPYKIDYLTTGMYAGIVFIYTIFKLRSKWVKLPLSLYSLFIVAISGARFSIIFISIMLIITFTVKFRKIFFAKSFFLIVLLLAVVTSFFVNKIESKQLTRVENIFDFSIMRFNHFNKYDPSLISREQAITKSINSINNHPFFGYGIHSSPQIIHTVYPHNMFLEVWLDAGVVGALALLIITTTMLSVLYFSIQFRSLLTLGIINLYIILSHLKSFSIIHSLLLFAFAGISVSALIYAQRAKKSDLKP